MRDDFKRDLPYGKKREVKAIFSSNKSSDITQSTDESGDERANTKNLADKMGFWGYTFTVFSVGLTIGLAIGATVYSIAVPSDAQLAEQLTFQKREVLMLQSDNEVLNNKVESNAEEKKVLEEKINQLASENSNLKDNSDNTTEKSSSREPPLIMKSQKSINKNQTETFLNGEIYVSVNDVGVEGVVNITVGSTGYDPLIKTDISTGTQFNYKAAGNYEVRITEIDYIGNLATVLVNKIN